MENHEQQIEILKAELSGYQHENQVLKEILEEAGVPYKDRLEFCKSSGKEEYEPNQGARIKPLQITDNTANYFFQKFWGRQDVYDLRTTNVKTGKTGYYTQCFNFWCDGCHKKKRDGVACKDCEFRAYKPLTKEIVLAHLIGRHPLGNDVLAVYPMLENNTCRFLVFDFDNHTQDTEVSDSANVDDTWKEEVDALRKICGLLGIDSLTERSRSGRGAHIWIFFEKPIPAKTARQFGFTLLEKGAESVNLKSFTYYDRMIPTQDVLPEGGLGNVVALPLQGQALKHGNSAFVDENWNAYPDQLSELWKVKRLSPEFVEQCIEKWQEMNPFREVDSDSKERIKPWESGNRFVSQDINGIVQITLSNMVYIDAQNLRPRIQNQIRRMAAFSNPVFYRNQAIGISNYEESRYIYLGKDENGYICIPRGLEESLIEKLQAAKIRYEIDDKRISGKPIRVRFRGELRESQIPAALEMAKHDTGILNAATAFGKTVVCCDLIARRQVNTLILLESSALIDQWVDALETFLEIDEEPPEYQTKSGRTKRRKSVIGRLQGSHDSLTSIIDIAMVGSVCRKGEFHPLLNQYGQIIVDECHHAASQTVMEILSEAKAKYVYGVTATPMRGDGKEKINTFLLGPIRYKYTSKDRAKEQGIDHLVYPRFTRTVAPHHTNEKMHPNEAYEIIRNNSVREEQILADVKTCVEQGRTPVVLSKYRDQAERLSKEMQAYADKVILMLGGQNKKEQKRIRDELNAVNPEESLILVATGKLIGEGFDYPRLDTLIMATPVRGRSIVEQYAGRLNRDYKGKTNVIIYDYVDAHIPMFDRMYAQRLKAYRQIGYDICTGIPGEKQKANAIFDIDTYGDIYWQDLEEATKEIVISSPRLNNYKVNRLISALKARQQSGLKVTIVTWHPDYYKYGKSDFRMELMERLRQAGFRIELVEQTCERFAVIDNKIVWYGSVNLLSKEDIEDNLMRVESPEIASELLELTFGKNISMQEW